MSINPFDDPSAGLPADEVTSLAAALAAAEFRAQHLEPVVRDLNRHLTDLLGTCPDSPTGVWVTLTDDNEPVVHLDVPSALRLSVALRRIAEELELEEIRSALPGRSATHTYFTGLYESQLMAVENRSVHITPRRGRGAHRGGH